MNNQQKTVTVVIATANRPGMLRTALASVAAQSARDRIAGVIVSENGGNSASRAICAEFPELPIHYVFRDPPISALAHARVLMQELPDRELTAILHDDDWWREDHLANAIQGLANHPGASAYYSTFYDVMDESGPRVQESECCMSFWVGADYPVMTGIWELGPWEVALASMLCTPGRYSTLASPTWALKEALSAVHRLDNPYDNDRMLAMEFAALGKILFSPAPGVFIRSHANQDNRSFDRAVQRAHLERTSKWMATRVDSTFAELGTALVKRIKRCPLRAKYNLLVLLTRNWQTDLLEPYGRESPELRRYLNSWLPHRPGFWRNVARPFLPKFAYSLRNKLFKLLSPYRGK